MHGLRLDLKSRMLLHGNDVFINGEHHRPGRAALPVLTQLADARAIGSAGLRPAAAQLLRQWYCCGYVWPGEKHDHGQARQTAHRRIPTL
jgi:hypothetical protein